VSKPKSISVIIPAVKSLTVLVYQYRRTREESNLLRSDRANLSANVYVKVLMGYYCGVGVEEADSGEKLL